MRTALVDEFQFVLWKIVIVMTSTLGRTTPARSVRCDSPSVGFSAPTSSTPQAVCIHRGGTMSLPRAHIDPIDSAAAAWALIDNAIARPLRHEVIAILLDAERRGHAIVVVSDTHARNSIHDVADVIAHTAAQDIDLGAVVLASVRPDADPDPDDVDRGLEISNHLADASDELLDWFIVGGCADVDSIRCPRDLLGEPPRWSS
jgi:hypothetical protein